MSCVSVSCVSVSVCGCLCVWVCVFGTHHGLRGQRDEVDIKRLRHEGEGPGGTQIALDHLPCVNVLRLDHLS